MLFDQGTVKESEVNVMQIRAKNSVLSLIILTIVFTTITYGYADVFPGGEWNTGWSGFHANVNPTSDIVTPDNENALNVRWSRTENQNNPNLGRSFTPTVLNGDVSAFWLRVSEPTVFLQVSLTDSGDLIADISVLKLLGVDKLEPGRWYYVVWPFRVNSGWIHGPGLIPRVQMYWDKVKAINFYTKPELTDKPVTLEVGPFHTPTYSELNDVFERHPDRVSGNRSIPLQVITDKRTDTMLSHYCIDRAMAKTKALRKKYPADKFIKAMPKIRKTYANNMLLPPIYDKPEASLVRNATIDGIDVEVQLIRTRPWAGSTAWIYKPAGTGKHPAILMLPGHGDPGWSGGTQIRGLTFAKRGYLVMFVMPFGQNERGDNHTWKELHDSQATAFLLPTGQSIQGVIMADHRAELSYLCNRPDVDPNKIGVTGISMGGSHTIWLTALDTRVAAAVSVASPPMGRTTWVLRHQGMCDILPDEFNIVDEEMIRGLIAPRALMQIYPDTERPVPDNALSDFHDGLIDYQEMLDKYGFSEEQLAKWHTYTLDVYKRLNAESNYALRIIPGPHDYTPPMREAAAGWFAHFLKGQSGIDPVSEPEMSPIDDKKQGRAMLDFWPDGDKPADVLGPTEYTKKITSELVSKLPAPPAKASDWKKSGSKLRANVRKLLKVDIASTGMKMSLAGEMTVDGTAVRKLIVQPEPGIELPVLLFKPTKSQGREENLVVMMHPDGMQAVATSDLRKKLTSDGAWVMCLDPRGVGQVSSVMSVGAYIGIRDVDLGNAALKLGDTLAGYWVKDLLAAVDAARKNIGGKVHVTVRGEREMGFVAMLAAGQSDAIDAVETTGLLASYYCAEGYGLPFAYADDKLSKSVRERKLGGCGSIVPCIPNMLKYADIPQLAALVAPKPLSIVEPIWASGNPVQKEELDKVFSWTKRVYHLNNREAALTIR